MAESNEEKVARIERLTRPGFRGNLIARGLARGLVWRDGVSPPGAPAFSPELSTDLPDHGFQLLSVSLDLRAAAGDPAFVRHGLYAAAESLESASRHERRSESERGFHLTMAAAAFHIGGFAARAYSLFEGELAAFNLSSCETALVHLMRRNLDGLRQTFGGWLGDATNSDDAVLARLQASAADEDDDFGADDVVAMALTRLFHRAIATYELGLTEGVEAYYLRSIEMFLRGEAAAAEAKHVPLWWAFKVARHLCDDLWRNSLRVVLPKDGGPPEWAELREAYIRMLVARDMAEIDLWPSQLAAAVRVVDTRDDLVVALPTSSGKTRIAELCILRTLADRQRVIYVTPLRALSAQIEHGLARTFRPLGISVTSVYGASGIAQNDLETLRSAQIVVSTPEKLDFGVRQDPSVIDDVKLIVLDEGHMIGLGSREIRYEMLVQRLLRRPDADSRRLVCLSAVFAEGEAFDDFTAWLRSDAPGTPLRSTWRPTRLRPGRLVWSGTAGALELEVDKERPFVRRFVEPRPAQSGRRAAFPNNAQEFVVAATSSFLARGQSVLVYCPEKRSVEPMAEAFLAAHRQGYFSGALEAEQSTAMQDAMRLGNEWLGSAHPVIRCLALGVAVHHGSLPRPYLNEIENLLRRRILPVCVCSPTLAQGLDLSFGVLLFKSLFRRGEPIPAKEFANVTGRVGRAFVDLDGLYVLPIFEKTASVAAKRAASFRSLIRAAENRQLESGVKELVGGIIRLLKERLGCDAEGLAEYVLNAGSTWEIDPRDDEDEGPELLQVALNELDTAILGVVEALDTDADGVADYLDTCLQSSYWQRRLRNDRPDVKDAQAKVIKGRATWLWKATTPALRKAFFASGVGYKAGAALEGSADALGTYLRDAERALHDSDPTAAAGQTALAAEIIFAIGPFEPEGEVGNLEALLRCWLSGRPLSDLADQQAIAFVQENVVYRLVWGVESVRLHLQNTRDLTDDAPGEFLAMCLTYGVPNLTAALLMQAGLRLRSVATAAAEMIEEEIANHKQLKAWVRRLRKGEVEPLTWAADECADEWNRFLDRFGHRHFGPRKEETYVLPVTWTGPKPPKPKSRVRVFRRPGGASIVSGVSSLPLGTIRLPGDIVGRYVTGVVRSDRKTIRIRAFKR